MRPARGTSVAQGTASAVSFKFFGGPIEALHYLVDDDYQGDPEGRDHLIDSTKIQFVSETFAKFLGKKYERLFFGQPVTTAMRQGFRLTYRGYLETVESPTSLATVDTTIRLLSKDSNSRLEVLDLFLGMGQMSWAFCKNDFHVTGIERHKNTFAVASHNLSHSGFRNRSRFILDDAVSRLAHFKRAKRSFNVVYLDPPWDGSYKYDLDLPFRLCDTNPNLDFLIEQSLEVTSLVVVKFPLNVESKSIEHFLLNSLHPLEATLEYQLIEGFPMEMNQCTCYFQRSTSTINRTLSRHRVFISPTGKITARAMLGSHE